MITKPYKQQSNNKEVDNLDTGLGNLQPAGQMWPACGWEEEYQSFYKKVSRINQFSAFDESFVLVTTRFLEEKLGI